MCRLPLELLDRDQAVCLLVKRSVTWLGRGGSIKTGKCSTCKYLASFQRGRSFTAGGAIDSGRQNGQPKLIVGAAELRKVCAGQRCTQILHSASYPIGWASEHPVSENNGNR